MFYYVICVSKEFYINHKMLADDLPKSLSEIKPISRKDFMEWRLYVGTSNKYFSSPIRDILNYFRNKVPLKEYIIFDVYDDKNVVKYGALFLNKAFITKYTENFVKLHA